MRSILLVFTLFVSVYGSRSRRYTNVVRMDVQSPNETIPADNKEYCFHYTWLKNEDNVTFAPYVDKTCQDKFSSSKPRPLCQDPMLVTDNGEEPDSNWLFNNKFKDVRCNRYKGFTCAKFVYYFNGEVENITKYCTKITVNEMSMESGCVTSSNGAHTTEVCACTGMVAGVPCNTAHNTLVTYPLLPLVIIALINIIR